jgi:hypothetical protein
MTDKAFDDLYSPIASEEPVVSAKKIRRIPIIIRVFDPDNWPSAVYTRLFRHLGAVNYAVPEPVDEQNLVETLSFHIVKCLLVPVPPTGVAHGRITPYNFSKQFPRYMLDDLYDLGINPIMDINGFGTILWSQCFISKSGIAQKIVLPSGGINPNFWDIVT